MDVQLQELIDKIKKDGVASAETSAQQILSDAEKKAASIISDAEEKAAGIVKNAKAETARMEKASEDAIAQAGRNLIISFRDSVTNELSYIVQEETAKSYDKDLLKKLIPETVKAWASKPDADNLTVLLPAKELKDLKSNLQTALKSEIAKGLELKADATLTAGFRISSKNGNAFYDFSADEVANLFSSYLNPKTAEIMKVAAKGIPSEKSEKAESKKEIVTSEIKAGAKKVAKKVTEKVAEVKKEVKKAAKSAAKGKKA